MIDSWSDDETADHLLVGLRQVRRLAQRGELVFFLVNRKRRYPVWQFGASPYLGECLPLDAGNTRRVAPGTPPRVHNHLHTRA